MTDQEVIEYIKSHIRDYDKAFGPNTLIGLWIQTTPELEAWVKAAVEANTGKKVTKSFLDDLPEVEETASGAFEEAYDELNDVWEEAKE